MSAVRARTSGVAVNVSITSVIDVATGSVLFSASASGAARRAQALGSLGVRVEYNVVVPAGAPSAAAQTVQTLVASADTSNAGFASAVVTAAQASPAVAQTFATATAVTAPVGAAPPAAAASLPLGAIVGGAVGALVVIGLLALVYACCCRPSAKVVAPEAGATFRTPQRSAV